MCPAPTSLGHRRLIFGVRERSWGRASCEHSDDSRSLRWQVQERCGCAETWGWAGQGGLTSPQRDRKLDEARLQASPITSAAPLRRVCKQGE